MEVIVTERRFVISQVQINDKKGALLALYLFYLAQYSRIPEVQNTGYLSLNIYIPSCLARM